MRKVQIVKRSGEREPLAPRKIEERLYALCDMEPKIELDLGELQLKLMAKISDGTSSRAIDEETAKILSRFHAVNEQKLADRMAVSCHHKNIVSNIAKHLLWLRENGLLVDLDPAKFVDYRMVESEVIDRLWYYTTYCMFHQYVRGKHIPAVNPFHYRLVMKYADAIYAEIPEETYASDYAYTFHGLNEMMYKEYFGHVTGSLADQPSTRNTVECPHTLYLGVSLAVLTSGEHTDYDAARYEPVNWTEEERMQLSDIDTGVIAHPSDWEERFRRCNNPAGIAKIKRKTWQEYATSLAIPDVNITEVIALYRALSTHKFSFATPVLHSYRSMRQQGGSCFVPMYPSDSLDGINQFNRDIANISKSGGGIGYSADNIRGPGTPIASTNGRSKGAFGYSKMIERTMLTVDQGGGRRNGAAAEYYSPHNIHIEARLEQAGKTLSPEISLQSIKLGLWVPDEFYRCVLAERAAIAAGVTDETKLKLWYLMDPRECPGLDSVYDEELVTKYITDPDPKRHAFTHLYRKYIAEGKYVKRISANELNKKFYVSCINFGGPYICHKDAGNRKSNQKNFGVIYSSNLCTEIFEVSSPVETAVCNLASVRLSSLVKTKYVDGVDGKKILTFLIDYVELEATVRMIVRYLNRVMLSNYYPTRAAYNSNMLRLPMGIGVMGWHSALQKMEIPFESEVANRLLFGIFEKIYYVALDESSNIAKEVGRSYTGFEGSPISKGLFHFDLCRMERPGKETLRYPLSLDWDSLRAKIVSQGLRNSLFIAPMPTASTSSILLESPSMEPHNVVTVKSIGYEYMVVSRMFIEAMESRGIYNPEAIYNFIESGSDTVSSIKGIPEELIEVFKGPWEVTTEARINNYLTIAPFVDQGMSFNLFINGAAGKTSTDQMLAWMVKLWSNGAKNGMYYAHSPAPTTGGRKKKDVAPVTMTASAEVAAANVPSAPTDLGYTGQSYVEQSYSPDVCARDGGPCGT